MFVKKHKRYEIIKLLKIKAYKKYYERNIFDSKIKKIQLII